MSEHDLIFPPHDSANDEGLLCYGGNLNPDILLHAYMYGIFPWYDETTPILWWSPPERMIIRPDDLYVSKSLRSIIKKGFFTVKFDTDFKSVIKACGSVPRKNQSGTWITKEMEAAYVKLHKLGYAHSVEVYKDGILAGGLYGVSLGKVFFGESMFHFESNASKLAFYYLIQKLKTWQFHFIDCQQETELLSSLGAYKVERKNFLSMLKKALTHESKKGKWTER